MTHRHLVLLSLITALFLGGCSDYSLLLLPPAGGPSTSGGSTVVPPVPSSPWGSLDPGDFPEAFFAVVWNDPQDACVDCGVLNRYDQPRYDILDSQGNVAVHFELPWAGADVYHRSLQPAGPGRFLAVSRVFGEGTVNGSAAWFGDGRDGEVDVVLEWAWGEREVYVPGTGRIVELPEGVNQARVVPDPHDPHRVYLLARMASATESLFQARLYSIDVHDPEEPVLEWYPEDMLPQELRHLGAAPWYPWFLQAFEDGTETLLVIGVWSSGLAGQNIPSFLVGFSPETGPSEWKLDLTETGVVLDDHYGRQLSVRPPLQGEASQAVLHPYGSSFNNNGPSFASLCHAPGFTTWDGAESVDVDSSEGLGCMRIGPLLEPSTSTFLYFGQEPDSELEAEERLVISHEGQDVWDYTSFRDGLVDRPFDIHEIASLELLSE